MLPAFLQLWGPRGRFNVQSLRNNVAKRFGRVGHYNKANPNVRDSSDPARERRAAYRGKKDRDEQKGQNQLEDDVAGPYC